LSGLHKRQSIALTHQYPRSERNRKANSEHAATQKDRVV
jgi:hypothetical protein